MDDRVPTPADLFLSPDLTEAQARAYLESLGFRNAAASDAHLQRMADDPVVREALGRLAQDLIPALLETPDPDAGVATLSHYLTARTGRAMFLDYLREDPRALHVLTYVMGASPALSEVLIRTPEYFHWLVPQVERSAPDRQDHEEELRAVLATVDDPAEALNILRRWKRRETLRIGTRELLRRETVQTVAAQLSDLADVAVDFALAIVTRQLLDLQGRDTMPGGFAVLAVGQLGAQELSYASDIDLLYVYDTSSLKGADAEAARVFHVKAGCDLTAALRDETHEGHLYRVGLPQWPQADGWLRACSLEEYGEHFAKSVDAPERGALARVRAIAGDADLGRRFIAASEAFAFRGPGRGTGVEALPDPASDPASADIDRVTQVFQLRHGAAHAPLRHVGTLATLAAMGRAGLIDEAVRRELDHAYVFLRSAEHRRQLGVQEDVDKQLAASRERVREICRDIVQRS
jgi:glutamate-ammonia-ligase adenylyltransferase